MNFDFSFGSSGSSTNSSRGAATTPDTSSTFDCLLNGVVVGETNLIVDSAVAAGDTMSKSDDEDACQPSLCRYANGYMQNLNCKNVANNFDYEKPQGFRFADDYLGTINKFSYVLMAPTSPAVKLNEESLTYLNQGQNYELRIRQVNTTKLINGTSSIEDIKPLINMSDKMARQDFILENPQLTEGDNADKLLFGNELHEACSHDGEKVYMSIIRLCFWDRKLQEIEHEEIKEVNIIKLKI